MVAPLKRGVKLSELENKRNLMIIDHIGLPVSDYEKTKVFYQRSLKPLGITLIRTEGNTAGFGKGNKAMFWIGPRKESYYTPIHIGFFAENRIQVDEFYKAALAAGGIDNGAPGIREIYHPNYYGAFVFDPDGHNIEAVCHSPEEDK